MAQQDEGIMALMGAGSAPAEQAPQIDMREFRRQAFPVTKEAVREASPEAYGEMQSLLSSELAAAGDLDPESLDQMLQIVDYINDHPEEYPQIREALIASDLIDPDDFPKEMDVEYFATMQVVLEEAAQTQRGEAAEMVQGPAAMMPPQGFAKGGIAEAAQLVASKGRYGDTMLAHITPSEARLLKARGGSGTINPQTGLPEFFLKKAFKAVTKPVTKVVKKVLASPVGRIAATVGLSMLGVPPWAASALVTKAAGGSWKDTFKAAAVAYLASPAGPIGNYVKGMTPALNSLNPALATGLRAGLTGTGAALLTGSNLKQAVTAGVTSGLMAGVQAARADTGAPVDNRTTQDGMAVRESGAGLAPSADTGTGTDLSGGTFDANAAASGNAPTTLSASEFQTATDFAMPEPITPGPGVQVASADANAGIAALNPPGVSTAANPNPFVSAGDPNPMTTTVLPSGQVVASGGTGTPGGVQVDTPSSSWDSFKDTASSAWESTKEFMYPSAPTDAQIADRAAQIKADYSARGLNISDTAAINSATEALTPGIIEQYGPAAGATLGVAALSGAFEAPEDDEPTPTQTALETPIEVPETLRRPIQNLPGVEYDEQGNIIGSKAWNPYAGINPATPTRVETQGIMGLQGSQRTYPQQPMMQQPMMVYPQVAGLYQQPVSPMEYSSQSSRNPTPTGFKAGGIAALAKGGYPRRIGQISGPGTETSDDIPAMLSDGEFVMTAGAVRGAGNGSRREGAKKMYALMHQLEQNAARG
jgi:hypothetical protein